MQKWNIFLVCDLASKMHNSPYFIAKEKMHIDLIADCQ